MAGCPRCCSCCSRRVCFICLVIIAIELNLHYLLLFNYSLPDALVSP